LVTRRIIPPNAKFVASVVVVSQLIKNREITGFGEDFAGKSLKCGPCPGLI
jgi:hypothetical protein